MSDPISSRVVMTPIIKWVVRILLVVAAKNAVPADSVDFTPAESHDSPSSEIYVG
jgi:hypothetical protein